MKSYRKGKNEPVPGLSVADQIPAMLAYWDKFLICRFANAAYLTWFGKKSEDMINKITISELLGPIYELNYSYIKAALGGAPQTFEREITLPSGDTRITLTHYMPDIENGETKGFFSHVADIHQLKLLQKDLIKSNEIINEQNKRLLNFANVVSHNLRAYSGNLDSLLGLLERAENEQEKSVIFNYLRDLSSGFSSTVNHLSEIADVQNLEKRQHEKANLFEYVSKTVDALRMQTESAHAIVHNHVDPKFIIFTNLAYLESIILNLLTNAVKYRHPDRQLIVDIDAKKEADGICLRIRDNGVGIDLARHGHELFGMYKTFHGNPDAKGIGLFLTKYQIESLGGYIRVESEVNQGTTFDVLFKT